jgi:hypothetical protein
MKRDVTRKQFLHLSLGATAAAILLPACGGDDGDDTGAGTDATTGGTNPTTEGSTNPIDPTEDPSTSGDTTADPSTSGDPTEDPTTGGTSTESTGAVDTTGDSGTTGAAGCGADPTADFDLHDHTLTVPFADIQAGVEMVYNAGGAHTHTVTLTAQDFATLLETGTVQVQSSFDGHPHTVTLTCP